MSDSQPQVSTGDFVRGYFRHLESRGVVAAVLHGWEGGFEGELSDVDHVVEAAAFPNIARLVEDYCASVGWRMCQVLRHETTAAFCVCSAIDDPSRAVALDACSDYQRNGSLLMAAGELLASRQPLEWGGFRLGEAAELQYRFIKAAAKEKPAAEVAEALQGYPEAAKADCVRWLKDGWGVELAEWSADSLERVLRDVHRATCKPVRFLLPSSLGRILRRIVAPTGLIVALGDGADDGREARLHEVFDGLYFRRGLRARSSGWRCWVMAVKTTLVTMPRVAGWLRLLLPRDCVMPGLPADRDPVGAVAAFLHERCRRRERLNG